MGLGSIAVHYPHLGGLCLIWEKQFQHGSLPRTLSSLLLHGKRINHPDHFSPVPLVFLVSEVIN